MPPVKSPKITHKPGNFCPVCGQSYMQDYWTDGEGNPFFVHKILRRDNAPGQFILHGCLADQAVFDEWQKSSDRTLAAIEADKAAERLRASDPMYQPGRDRR